MDGSSFLHLKNGIVISTLNSMAMPQLRKQHFLDAANFPEAMTLRNAFFKRRSMNLRVHQSLVVNNALADSMIYDGEQVDLEGENLLTM